MADETLSEQETTEVPEKTESHPKREHEDEEVCIDRDNDRRWPGWPGENVFRLLVPAQKVGGIIGRKGELIKKMCEESRTRIKILDGIPGAPERAVMISAKEELDAAICPAIDGLMKVHKRVIDGLEGEAGKAPPSAGGSTSTRLLLAATQAGSLIGKHGSTIKSIQEESSCTIRVLGTSLSASRGKVEVVQRTFHSALADDSVVEIQGEPTGVHKAVELIAQQLRKFLVDKSVLPLFDPNVGGPNPHFDQGTTRQPWGHQQGRPYPGPVGSPFEHSSHYMPPPRQLDNYYPPSDFPSLDKRPHAFGRDVPIGAHQFPKAQPPQVAVTQITQRMQVPLSYADAVIGAGGSSISYIRRASGATITIQETRGLPGEMTVEINGSASQVQTAQQLIQNFIAEVAGPTANQLNTVAPSYDSYPPQKSMPTSSPPGGSAYGVNYGY